jgi:fused signal recognition particle receptor
LLNAKIDIKSEQDKKKEVEVALAHMAVREEPVASLEGVGEKTAEGMIAAGIKSVGDVIDGGANALTEIEGIGPVGADKILASAREALVASVAEEPVVAEGEAADDGPADETPVTSARAAARHAAPAAVDTATVLSRLAAAPDSEIATELAEEAEEAAEPAATEAPSESDDDAAVGDETDSDEEEVVETPA